MEIFVRYYKKIVGAMLAFVLVCTVLPVSQVDAQETVTIIDSLGYKVEIPYPVERVVSVDIFSYELIVALGGEDKLVGVEIMAKFFPEFLPTLQAKPTVGFFHYPSLERIFELNPQVLIYPGALIFMPGFRQKLEAAGIKAVSCFAVNPGDYDRDVRNLGIIFGKEKRAEEYLNFAHSYINMVQERVEDIPSDERVRVYWEVMWPGMTMGGYINSFIEMSGGRNIFAETGGAQFTMSAMPGMPMPPIAGEEITKEMIGGAMGEAEEAVAGLSVKMVKAEEIVERNPQVVIAMGVPMRSMTKAMMTWMKNPGMVKKMIKGVLGGEELSSEEMKEMLEKGEMMSLFSVGYTSKPDERALSALRDKMMNLPEIKVTDAGINGRVYAVPASMQLFMSPSWPVGLCYLAKAFYPDRFEDFDLEELHTKWLKEQNGLEYKGIWMYPEL